MTLHRLGAGNGYRYLTDQVAKGDGVGKGQDPMAYYQQTGNPAGRWMGTGAEVLGVEGEATTPQMHNLYGLGLHPVSGVQLGRRYASFKTVEERVRDRIDAAMREGVHLEPEQIAVLEHEELAKGERQAVAGFDTVFSPVKSVSLAWGLTPDLQVARQIEDAHHAAVAHVIAHAERDIVFARTGAAGVAQVDVAGIAVAAFDHRTSRSGDPDLHTHAVISNKVLARLPDGKTRWLTLDSAALHKAAVSMSERYNRVLEDEVTRRLGWQFEVREDQDPTEPTAIREIAGVPLAAIRGFSSRRNAIEATHQDLVADYHREHGHLPPKAEQYKMAQQATLTNRPPKELRETVGQERERWAGQAAELLGDGWGELVDRLVPGELAEVRTNRDVPDWQVAAFAQSALDDVTDRRSTWTVRHLQAAAQRATAGLTMASPEARDHLVDRIVRAVTETSAEGGLVMRLDPPELQPPAELQRAGGESVFLSHASERYTTTAQLQAEDRLLEHARRTDGPRVDEVDVRFATQVANDGPELTADQQAAVLALATSGSGVGLLIGPAGTGKTTTLRSLVEAWKVTGRTVHGLAPTAVAAAVLKAETGMDDAETLHRHELRGDWASYKAGDLVLVDEAGMVGTQRLLRVIDRAADAGAKVVLVGDHRQLGAIESGGALRLLTTDAPQSVAELTSVWRFADVDEKGKRTVRQWEADASLQLREGVTAGLEPYFEHGRVGSGASAVLVDQLYGQWREDAAKGWTSVMIAASNEVVADLGRRAREDLVADGRVEADGVLLSDGNRAGVGDVVVTRRNDRLLRAGREFVKNGDLWRVTDRAEDGSLTVEHTTHGGVVTLPAEYVADRVEQGYAMTVHRTQGSTVDTTHTLVDPTFNRATLYVAATRGRLANNLHVVTDHVLEPDLERPAEPAKLARAVLADVLRREDGDRSATETLREAYTDAGSLRTLLPRFRYAGDLYWTGQAKDVLAAGVEPDVAEQVQAAAAWPALADRLMLLEERGVDAAEQLRITLTDRPLTGADDVAAVLHARLDGAVEATRDSRGDWLPAAPKDSGPLPEYMRELRKTMESRAQYLGAIAAAERPEWTSALPDVPQSAEVREVWEQVAGRVAAYREAYAVEEDLLGPIPVEPRHAEARKQVAAAVQQLHAEAGPAADREAVGRQLEAAQRQLESAARDYWAVERATEVPDAERAAQRVDQAVTLLDRLDQAAEVEQLWAAEVRVQGAESGELARAAMLAEQGGSRKERKQSAELAALLQETTAARAARIEELTTRRVEAERGLPAREARDAARADAERTLRDADRILAEAREATAEATAQAEVRKADAAAAWREARARVEALEARAATLGVPVTHNRPDLDLQQDERSAEAGQDLER